MKIFLATGNKKKIDEMSKILDGSEFEILSIKDGIEIPEVIEDGTTFEENSRKKALEIAKFTNMITISDDSGLCVEALDGAPGVYSARYAGEDSSDAENNEKLIENLQGVNNRKAKFVTVITLGKPNGEFYSFRGEIEGIIIDEARGKDGFGYDPHFYLPEYDKTFAEMPEIKNQISHRARALNALKDGIDKILNIG
ncbi:MAG: XTP/dITP diphosphatase [Cetobacterium sp.]|uniref:XTP/dITP diphosphatase n=1 Tax=Cetobacterium sp. TaxID=2071632 RepID=UPI002FC90BF9